MPQPEPVSQSRMVDGRVLTNELLTGNLYLLRIEAELAPFEAGQFVRLELEVGGERIARPYSLVNPPHEPVAEILFNTVPAGVLSLALAALRSGDTVGVGQPASGFFTVDEAPAARDLWMFATGTGVGPYLSMLRTQKVWQRYERVVLVHGVRRREELVFQDVIDSIKQAYGRRFTAIGCVSREVHAQGLEGRVTEAVRSGALEDRTGFALSAADGSVMLCGNQAMINDMKRLLATRGMRRHLRREAGHILTEKYY
jgi:ferredoxin--NADP+ reductase